MPVKYTVVERANPLDRTKPKKFYPMAVADGEVSLKDMAKRAAQYSKLYRYPCGDHSPDGSDTRRNK